MCNHNKELGGGEYFFSNDDECIFNNILSSSLEPTKVPTQQPMQQTASLEPSQILTFILYMNLSYASKVV